MVILLTGATGFLGKYLLDDLSDIELRVVTRSPHKIKHKALDIVEHDIEEDLPPSCFDDVDVLIHSAAKVGSWPKDQMKGYYQTNILGTRSIISGAIKAGVPRIIYTSSYFALGSTGSELRNETWNNPPQHKHPYVTTKYEAGRLVDQFAEDFPILQLLPTVILGAGMDNVISDTLIDFINGRLIGLLGGGKHLINIVSAHDVARAHLIGITSENTGKYLIGGENLTLYDLFRRVAVKLDISPPRSVPYWIGTTYTRLLELFGKPPLTTHDIELTKLDYAYDCSKADIFGIHYKSTDEILDELLVDFLHRGILNKKGESRVLRYLGPD